MTAAPSITTPSLTPESAAEWDAFLRLFWHPVTRVVDVGESGVTGVRVLGTDLAVARLPAGPDGAGSGAASPDAAVAGDRWVAYVDRCPHRSARLSVGTAEPDGLRCAYHGWRFGDDGACNEIPSMPGSAISSSACTTSYRAAEAHGLVWVLLDDRLDPPIPPCPALDAPDSPDTRVLVPTPYTWPVGAPRRVENFTDLAHFAFIHDGSIGRRDVPVPPLPEIVRAKGQMAFRYDPPEFAADPTAMFGVSAYTVTMPLTVNIEFFMEDGKRRTLWMAACPVDLGVTESFWVMGRNDELDPSFDDAHIEFQEQILAEDEPVVCNQVPPEMVLTPGAEVSVKTDRVSIAYRRWLGELLAHVRYDGASHEGAAGGVEIDVDGLRATLAVEGSAFSPVAPGSGAPSTLARG